MCDLHNTIICRKKKTIVMNVLQPTCPGYLWQLLIREVLYTRKVLGKSVVKLNGLVSL